jgi:hypothetical protein
MIIPTPQALYEYYQRIPTTDLYFRHPIRHLHRREEAQLPPIRHVARNVYMLGRTGIVCRYAALADLDLLKKNGVTQIVYIADDDFAAGAADATLPSAYRARLAGFVEGAWPALRAAANIVLVSNRALAGIYGTKARLVQPIWHHAPADTKHFARPQRIEIVHLGTGSHRADLAPVASALAGILKAHPNARLTLFSGGDLPDKLKNHPQVRSRPALPWWLYKRLLPRMRFHLALYPLRESAFNAARSANKLYEHALVGAASLMSPNPALRDAAGPGLADLFVEGGAEEWRDRTENEIADFAACRRRAERTRAHILAADPLKQTTRQWLDILAGET